MKISENTFFNKYHEKLAKVLKRTNAKNIRMCEGNLVADIYDFTYEFICEGSVQYISFARSDGKYGIISEFQMEMANNILLPLMVYTKKQNEKEMIQINGSDAGVKIHLLLPGDSYISHERIFCENPVAHKEKTLYLVVEDNK